MNFFLFFVLICNLLSTEEFKNFFFTSAKEKVYGIDLRLKNLT